MELSQDIILNIIEFLPVQNFLLLVQSSPDFLVLDNISFVWSFFLQRDFPNHKFSITDSAYTLRKKYMSLYKKQKDILETIRSVPKKYNFRMTTPLVNFLLDFFMSHDYTLYMIEGFLTALSDELEEIDYFNYASRSILENFEEITISDSKDIPDVFKNNSKYLPLFFSVISNRYSIPTNILEQFVNSTPLIVFLSEFPIILQSLIDSDTEYSEISQELLDFY